ncbi:hypothetical protein BaRGS_00025312 [Batillaria attramentaria]|uniref:Uncharacterized protein n=1 Tax=Batillaria attramentaria TaxID=370345 RepID=A0ABD0K8G2_9CAEN
METWTRAATLNDPREPYDVTSRACAKGHVTEDALKVPKKKKRSQQREWRSVLGTGHRCWVQDISVGYRTSVLGTGHVTKQD